MFNTAYSPKVNPLSKTQSQALVSTQRPQTAARRKVSLFDQSEAGLSTISRQTSSV